MVDYLHKPVVHEAFFKKYASKKFLKGMRPDSLLQGYTDRVSSFNPHPPMGKEVPPSLPRSQSNHNDQFYWPQCLPQERLIIDKSVRRRHHRQQPSISPRISPCFSRYDQNMDGTLYMTRARAVCQVQQNHHFIAPFPSIIITQLALGFMSISITPSAGAGSAGTFYWR